MHTLVAAAWRIAQISGGICDFSAIMRNALQYFFPRCVFFAILDELKRFVLWR
jgi:hypothetical protein